MTVIFNQKKTELPEHMSLGEFLSAQGIAPAGVAVAVNGKVVGKKSWGDTPLTDGDNIMVITAVCGG